MLQRLLSNWQILLTVKHILHITTPSTTCATLTYWVDITLKYQITLSCKQPPANRLIVRDTTGLWSLSRHPPTTHGQCTNKAVTLAHVDVSGQQGNIRWRGLAGVGTDITGIYLPRRLRTLTYLHTFLSSSSQIQHIRSRFSGYWGLLLLVY